MEPEPLELKVMRLSPPDFQTTPNTISDPEQYEDIKNLIDKGNLIVKGVVPSVEAVLQTAVTKVLVGEEFRAYINLSNKSNADVQNVTMVVEMSCAGSVQNAVEVLKFDQPSILKEGLFLDGVIKQVLILLTIFFSITFSGVAT